MAIKTDFEKEEQIKDQIKREQAQLESQAAQLEAQINNSTPEDADKILSKVAADGGLTLDQVKEIQEDIRNGGDKNDVINKTFGFAFPVFFTQQLNIAKIPDGYHALDELVPFRTIENGAEVLDYQGFGEVFTENPYFVATDKTGKNFSKATTTQGEFAWMEQYKTKHRIRAQIITYMSLFTNAHKSALLFQLQFNYVIKKMGQKVLRVLYKLRMVALWNPTGFDAAINEDVLGDGSNQFGLNKVTLGAPTWNFKVSDQYDMVVQLNALLDSLSAPATDHFPKGSISETLFQLANDDGTFSQLERGIGLSGLDVVVSSEFNHIYDVMVKAGAFNMDEASLTNRLSKNMRVFKYEKTFTDPNFGNMAGINNDIHIGADGKIYGSTDIVITSKGVTELINQYNSTKEFSNPDMTQALNMFEDYGIEIHKDEDMVWGIIRIDFGAEPKPSSK